MKAAQRKDRLANKVPRKDATLVPVEDLGRPLMLPIPCRNIAGTSLAVSPQCWPRARCMWPLSSNPGHAPQVVRNCHARPIVLQTKTRNTSSQKFRLRAPYWDGQERQVN